MAPGSLSMKPMKSCNDCIQHLSEYMDGMLGARDATHLYAHLRMCPACREEYEGLLATRQALQTAAPPQARSDFWRQIKTVLQDQGTAQNRTSYRNRSISFFWRG